MRELADLQANPSPEFTAAPLEGNVFEWHFTLRGPPDAGFAGGRYHGRLIFPPEYPFKVCILYLPVHDILCHTSFVLNGGD